MPLDTSGRRLFALAILSGLCALAAAQPEVVRWTAKLDPPDVRAGEAARVLVGAEIDKGWHVYSLNTKGGPVATTIKLLASKGAATDGAIVVPKPKRKFDEGFGIEVGIYEGKPVFSIPVRIADDARGRLEVKVKAGWQACDANGCLAPTDIELSASTVLAPGPARPERTAAMTSLPEQAPQGPDEKPAGAADPSAPADEFGQKVKEAKASGLLAFMLLSFVGGLLALLTPCVFPMIPITVSFFSKRTEGVRKTNYGGALAYCLGIIATFSALGLIVTKALGESGIQDLAANPWINLLVFAVFVALALSLFGLYEIGVPSFILSKLGSGARTVGFVGPLLMGLTFSLTSFTCTVPIVGALLVAVAAGGDTLYPLMGMIAFSTAFSLPFFFLALFPDLLTRLPRSGAWMSQVKVFMGFVELAAAVKFLSNMDLVWGFGLLTQPVFIAVWVLICAVAGLQLLGWLRMGNEQPSPIGWLRRGFGVASLGTAGYLLAALNGAPLSEIAAFLPPDPYPGRASAVAASGPIAWRHIYDEALAAAKAEGKPLFINFTGVT